MKTQCFIFEKLRVIRDSKTTFIYNVVPCANYSTAIEMLRREPETYVKTTGNSEQDNFLIADFQNGYKPSEQFNKNVEDLNQFIFFNLQ